MEKSEYSLSKFAKLIEEECNQTDASTLGWLDRDDMINAVGRALKTISETTHVNYFDLLSITSLKDFTISPKVLADNFLNTLFHDIDIRFSAGKRVENLDCIYFDDCDNVRIIKGAIFSEELSEVSDKAGGGIITKVTVGDDSYRFDIDIISPHYSTKGELSYHNYFRLFTFMYLYLKHTEGFELTLSERLIYFELVSRIQEKVKEQERHYYNNKILSNFGRRIEVQNYIDEFFKYSIKIITTDN